jgi:hypothetical protein
VLRESARRRYNDPDISGVAAVGTIGRFRLDDAQRASTQKIGVNTKPNTVIPSIPENTAVPRLWRISARRQSLRQAAAHPG